MNDNLEMFGGAQQRRLTKCPHCGSEILSMLGAMACTGCDFRLADRPMEPDRDVTTAHARGTDPETSHDAAAGITTNRLRESQKEVWALFRKYGPMDDRELVRLADKDGIRQSPSGLRTRRRELQTMGKVRDSGRSARYEGNRKHIIWELR